MEVKILNKIHTKNVKSETSSTNYVNENKWELMESLQYSQSKIAATTNTLIIIIVFVIGIVLSITIFRLYTQKNFFL